MKRSPLPELKSLLGIKGDYSPCLVFLKSADRAEAAEKSVRSAERLDTRHRFPQSAHLLAEPLEMGESLDVAFTIDHNDHPDFGGLQLILSDWTKSAAAAKAGR